MAFFDEWKEKWESWSLAVKGAVIAVVLLLLVAAIEAGATVFLAPDDEITDEMRARYPDIKSNYEEVKEAAAKLGTDIKIYPVKTLDEAIEILKNL